MNLYVNIDAEGNIIDSLGGDNLILGKEYAYVFDVNPLVLTSIHLYKVVDGNLVERGGNINA